MILYATQKPQVGHHNLNYSITHFHTQLVVSTIKYGTRNSACAIPLFSASAALVQCKCSTVVGVKIHAGQYTEHLEVLVGKMSQIYK